MTDSRHAAALPGGRRLHDDAVPGESRRRRARRRGSRRPSRCSGSPTGRTSRRPPSCCRRATRTPTTASASSRRSRSCRSPGTRRSAPATPGSRRPAARRRRADRAGVRRRARADPADAGPAGVRGAAARALGPGRRERLAQVAAALSIEPRRRSWTPQWVDNGPGWVAVLLETAEAVLAAPAGARRPRRRRRRAVPGGRARGVRGAGLLPQGRRHVEDPVTGSLNASLASGSLRHRPRHRAVRRPPGNRARARRPGPHLRDEPDGQIWVGGGTVTCVRGEVAIAA